MGEKYVEKDMQRRLRSHPLFFGITMGLLAEIINSRLFTTVRDSLGLTYDVSFELSLFDRLNLGWYVISVTSTPEKVRHQRLSCFFCYHYFFLAFFSPGLGYYKLQVYKAVDACKTVLRGLHNSKIAQRELDRVISNYIF